MILKRGIVSLLFVVFFVMIVGCGGSSGGSDGDDDTSGGGNPWIGVWTAVSENGVPATGTLTLNSDSFSQTSMFAGGTCNWTGSVSNVTATNLTIATDTANGAAQCSNAIGRSASPTWAMSNGNNTLTLDYRGTIPFGTLQVWEKS